MNPSAFAFPSTFLPNSPELGSNASRSRVTSVSPELARKSTLVCNLKQPSPASSKLSLPAAILAAVSLAFAPPAKADSISGTLALPTQPALEMPVYPDAHTALTEGTLIQVHPAPAAPPSEPIHVYSQSATAQPTTPSAKPSSKRYSRQSATVSEWTTPALLQRSISSRGLSRLSSMRSSTTLGLVGVGALTSSSVILRSLRKVQMDRAERDLLDSARDVCSVVNVQIPFCVSERLDMLRNLEELSATAKIDTPEGMASVSVRAAEILLQEEGLFEDSSKFMPHIDVFLAENLDCAEKRFSGHVSIEGSRIDRLRSAAEELTAETRNIYGIVSMVIATSEGVDLACYSKTNTEVCNISCALEKLLNLKPGEVAGLELLWIPDGDNYKGLNREQVSETFPCLKIL